MLSNIDKQNGHELNLTAKLLIMNRFRSCGANVIEKDRTFSIVFSNGLQFEVLVKSIRRPTEYVLIQKKHMDIEQRNFYVALVIFSGNVEPEVFLIPATAFRQPNDLFRDRPHYKVPEYGMNTSNKNMPILNMYKFDTQIAKFKLDKI
jgi:hypothetical protein